MANVDPVKAIIESIRDNPQEWTPNPYNAGILTNRVRGIMLYTDWFMASIQQPIVRRLSTYEWWQLRKVLPRIVTSALEASHVED